ncbi:MAG: glycosyltransferase family 4 protein [Candidatus Binatia bacterium]
MRAELGIIDVVLMYVGNLQDYQGIDLLLKSFAMVLAETPRADLVIIGGQASDIQKYQKKSLGLGIQKKVHFLGPRPVEHLGQYLAEADILVSPRLKGNNTPMKLYSYLHSGKAVLATNLPTHTQLIDDRVALLVEPEVKPFSQAMLRLIEDDKLRVELGVAGKQLIEEKFTYGAFREKLNGLFDWLETELRPSPGSSKIIP